MSRGQRYGLIGLAVVVAVVAFVLVRPSGKDEPAREAGGPAAETQADTTAAKKPAQAEPQPELLELKGGNPVGGVKKIAVKQGQIVRLVVSSDAADVLHLHGYDLEKQLAPGKPASFEVKADIEGVFELESHEAGHAQVASLTVSPP